MNGIEVFISASSFIYLFSQAVPFNIKIEKQSKKIRETIERSIKFNITDIDELFNP